MGVLSIARWVLWSYGADSGIFTQAIAHTPDAFENGPEDGSHLAFHWMPLLGLLYPLATLPYATLALQFAQILGVAATALPLYALVRAHASEKLALRCALLALCYPPLAALAFIEFHELSFYPPLTVALIWAADRERWNWFTLFALATVLLHEEAVIVTTILGAAFIVVGMLPRSERDGIGVNLRGSQTTIAAGLLLIALSLTAGAAYLAILERLGPWRPSHFYAYPFANGPLAVLEAIARNPLLIGGFISTGKVTYCLEAFGPLLFLPLLSRWSLAAIPSFGVILLANNDIVWHMGSQYEGSWVPWLLIAGASVLIRWERSDALATQRWNGRSIGACALVLLFFDPLHPFHYLRPAYERELGRQALSTVPRDALILTHDEWFAHLASSYPHATTYPWMPYEYVVYAAGYPNDFYQRHTRPQIEDEARRGTLIVVRRFGDVTVYRRRLPPRSTLEPR